MQAHLTGMRRGSLRLWSLHALLSTLQGFCLSLGMGADHYLPWMICHRCSCTQHLTSQAGRLVTYWGWLAGGGQTSRL